VNEEDLKKIAIEKPENLNKEDLPHQHSRLSRRASNEISQRKQEVHEIQDKKVGLSTRDYKKLISESFLAPLLPLQSLPNSTSPFLDTSFSVDLSSINIPFLSSDSGREYKHENANHALQVNELNEKIRQLREELDRKNKELKEKSNFNQSQSPPNSISPFLDTSFSVDLSSINIPFLSPDWEKEYKYEKANHALQVNELNEKIRQLNEELDRKNKELKEKPHSASTKKRETDLLIMAALTVVIYGEDAFILVESPGKSGLVKEILGDFLTHSDLEMDDETLRERLVAGLKLLSRKI
jgi:uncharacterized small protein (DUF1192 family)